MAYLANLVYLLYISYWSPIWINRIFVAMKLIDTAQVVHFIEEWLRSSDRIKATLSSYKGSEPQLKNIYIKTVVIKRKEMLSFTYRYEQKDVVKNYTIEDAFTQLKTYLEANDFHAISLFGRAQNQYVQRQKHTKWSHRTEHSTKQSIPDLNHDKKKQRKLGDSAGKAYLRELRLTDEEGVVYKNAQDKWKQINHYIELLSQELAQLPSRDVLHVVDMGAGKGYLTFALYDYLTSVLKRPSKIVGVEYRDDLVKLCNTISDRAGFNGLTFQQGTIVAYEPSEDIDILIALHACDTATDEALFRGIRNKAQLIVAAPCCHKQIRRELTQNGVHNKLDFMVRHGVFMERHAEMLTDSIRVLILEYYGYQTKVLEFVSDAHTPKNVLLIGMFKNVDIKRQLEIKKQLHELKSYFGIKKHHLEKLLELDSN